MEKYTRQYLDRQDEEIEKKAKKEDEDEEDDEENKKEDFNTTTTITSQGKYDFKLKGIVVHIGSLDSGHYYSIIRDKNDSWYRFNDDTVEVYDIKSDLEYECFGGSKNSKGEPLKVSAYMLLYERVHPIQIQVDDTSVPMEQDDCSTSMSLSPVPSPSVSS